MGKHQNRDVSVMNICVYRNSRMFCHRLGTSRSNMYFLAPEALREELKQLGKVLAAKQERAGQQTREVPCSCKERPAIDNQ